MCKKPIPDTLVGAVYTWQTPRRFDIFAFLSDTVLF